MGFWKNVDNYIKFKKISRSTLASAIDMKVQTLNRAIIRDSSPTFIEGLKTCAFLNVHPDFLLDSPLYTNFEDFDISELKSESSLYRKHHDLIQQYEKLSDSQQKAIIQLIKSLAESSTE